MGNQKTEQQKREETLKRFGLATGAMGATALMTTQANALDVTTATQDSSAKTDIETAGVWLLGIAIVYFSAKKVIAFFGR